MDTFVSTFNHNYDLIKLIMSYVSDYRLNEKDKLLCYMCRKTVIMKKFDKIMSSIFYYEAYHYVFQENHYRYIEALICKNCNNELYSQNGLTFINEKKEENNNENSYSSIINIIYPMVELYSKFINFSRYHGIKKVIYLTFSNIVTMIMLYPICNKKNAKTILAYWLHVGVILFFTLLYILHTITFRGYYFLPKIKYNKKKFAIFFLSYAILLIGYNTLQIFYIKNCILHYCVITLMLCFIRFLYLSSSLLP